ncbi:MAG: hypothetical protein QME96_19010, partial [Myxococcota bacterium]|nr:hypothetical protein [Myxococcota bacterium]
GFTCTAAGACSCPGTVCGSACCAAGQICISGQCCNPNWRADFPGTFLKGIAADSDGTFIVAGSVGAGLDLADGHQALAIQIDACGREVDREAFMPTGAVRARANTVAVSRTNAYVAGVMGPSVSSGGASDGFVTRLAKSPLPVGLFVEVHIGLRGGDLNDEIGDVAIADDGSLWFAGVSEAAPAWANHCAWTVKGNAATGAACGWNPFGDCTADSAWGMAAVPSERRVYLAGRRGARAFLAGWS